MKRLVSTALLLAAVALAGCTVHQTEAPGLTGPSGLALTIRVAALPDSISQDGGSQSSIQVTAIGADGQPKNAVPVRVDMFVNGVGQDYGTLSARSLVTNSSGVANVVYTAPPAPTAGIFGTCKGLPGNCVEIVATPRGTVTLPDDGTREMMAQIAAAPSSDRYFFYPRLEMLPFLTAREHASKYNVFSPGFTSPSQYQEACISALRYAAWLVIDRNWTDPVFLRASYPTIGDAEPPETKKFERALHSAFDFVAQDGAFELRQRVKTMNQNVCAGIAE
jgi:hypothetical protein